MTRKYTPSSPRRRKPLGALDLLVNHAGIAGGERASAEELSLERWDEMLHVNFRGYLLMSRAALAWLAKDRGVVVNNASSIAISSAPGSLSCPSSGALRTGTTESDIFTGHPGIVNSPRAGCCTVANVPRARRNGSFWSSIVSKTAPLGTPAPPRMSITSCFVR
jgi:NAD(P)-dependent dehydrogenase (short-subunit alcohol dehydrogenase family)